jgi:CubicO group peptidase (beta-lactamase class C family)
VLTLVDQGRLSLDAKVQDLLPGFVGDGKDAVRLRHLLTHTAGLPPFLRFFATLEGRAAIVDAAAAVPLEAEPGARYRYSDIGMMLVMAVVEKVTGEPFEDHVARAVFAPLGMRSATFVRSGAPIDAVPTEDDRWRGRVVRGEVHDENAFAFTGTSGHAGLFGTAADVAAIARIFRDGAVIGNDLAALARTEHVKEGNVRRGIGLALRAPDGPMVGRHFSVDAYGHTGFTGTSVWIDPQLDLTVVLLTNRVYFGRGNDDEIYRFRIAVHEAVSAPFA